jgi:hypothetical protein
LATSHFKSCGWLALLLSGCFNSAPVLTPEAKKVELVNETSSPINCKQLEKITGKARGSDEKTAREGAENDFRNHAAELKANYALIEVERANNVGTTTTKEVFIGGRALFCKTLEMEADEEKKHEQALKEKEEQEQKAQEEKERKEQEEKDKQAVEEQKRKDEEAEAKKKKKK